MWLVSFHAHFQSIIDFIYSEFEFVMLPSKAEPCTQITPACTLLFLNLHTWTEIYCCLHHIFCPPAQALTCETPALRFLLCSWILLSNNPVKISHGEHRAGVLFTNAMIGLSTDRAVWFRLSFQSLKIQYSAVCTVVFNEACLTLDSINACVFFFCFVFSNFGHRTPKLPRFHASVISKLDDSTYPWAPSI